MTPEELARKVRAKWCVTGDDAKNVVVVGRVDRIVADILDMVQSNTDPDA